MNLTPHDVVIDPRDGGPPVRCSASDTVPRILLSGPDGERLRIADPAHPNNPQAVREVPLVVDAAWLGVEPHLPEPRAGAVYVTSRLVAEHFPERGDLVWPEGLIGDERGEVVAARRFARIRPMERAPMGASRRGTDK